MKKITSALFFLIPLLGISQNAEQKIQAYLDANRSKLGLSAQDVSDWVVDGKLNSESTGIDNYFVKQRFNGTEVFASSSNFWIKNGQVINVAGENFVANLSQKINTVNPQLDVLQALASGLSGLGIQSRAHTVVETISPKNFVISNDGLEPITAELVYQVTPDGNLRLAWDFTIETKGHHHVWSIRVDAVSGTILAQNDMVVSCNFDAPLDKPVLADNRAYSFSKDFFKPQSALEIQSGSYRVIPRGTESPAFGPRQLVVSPHNVTASPYGWHDTNGSAGNEFTTSRGNNVAASEDRDGDDSTAGTFAQGGASLTFDFPYTGTNVETNTYTPAATTNLFYMNNIMHDVWYQYGFNEINGNFQQNNYGNGGATSFLGDAVVADSQDSADQEPSPTNRNNANFATFNDGTRPRMQMYVWDYAPRFFFVNSPAALTGGYQATQNQFNPGHVDVPVSPNMIQTDLVLYQDTGASTNEACVAPSNAAQMAGKIVLIRRGNCDFTIKVENAQNAGAVAVVITDNVPMQLVNMSGANANITIPAIFITKELGDALIAAMQTSTVNVKLSSPPNDFVNADGDFDNGIIAHEYGHGISTRLTGGPMNSSCLFNDEAMGEGWSDWFALMMQLKAGDVGTTPKGIAAFASNQPAENGGGIRSLPYSTDMAINGKTFGDSNTTSGNYRYDVGEVWASMLWDLTWAYINKYGFDPNVYTGTGGNNKVMRLVLDGLKLQPCSPGFVSARNAIIAADQATTGGQDYCMIWEVFARRGLGVNASSGSTSNANDQVEDFTEPTPGANCTLGLDYFHNEDDIRVYPNPTNGTVNIRINNYSGNVNIQVVDVNGRVVFQKPNAAFNNEHSIDLSHLQTGMYVVKVNAENINISRKLIVN
ncbi:T9SS type A sorting domain-containing protein [Flavobacterium sp. MAH-1]|uniref:T9SS-dependent M36 family metallopeptidase n=1 Tax=Flavobacterium agri TaxID=2743471 RepID=A0A7Y8Y314_9FLAO|nr:T9SS-dependent M36 family metallopeptidase [Flavobacterium agri]NUY81547.1 T9SS type A sorting domain-containing protein [Flavobacterium agri]NYA71571.1 T9SS-dependent M36 family metallopeptidase [Flavobacterium agri]